MGRKGGGGGGWSEKSKNFEDAGEKKGGVLERRRERENGKRVQKSEMREVLDRRIKSRGGGDQGGMKKGVKTFPNFQKRYAARAWNQNQTDEDVTCGGCSFKIKRTSEKQGSKKKVDLLHPGKGTEGDKVERRRGGGNTQTTPSGKGRFNGERTAKKKDQGGGDQGDADQGGVCAPRRDQIHRTAVGIKRVFRRGLPQTIKGG